MSNDGDALGTRMRTYEQAAAVTFPRRLPLIVRLDGRAFHSFTRKMLKPHDPWMVQAMLTVATTLCEEVEGCQLAYWQSDEISLLVRDDMALGTQAWFAKNLQKVVSVAAGIASATMTYEWIVGLGAAAEGPAGCAVASVRAGLPTFDARAFILPPAEVCNYMIFRQQDAVRNSILGLGQAHFSAKQMHGLKCSQVQEKLWQEKQINWNDTPTHLKRGACVVRETYEVPVPSREAIHEATTVTRHRWVADMETPTFTQDRQYIEKHLGESTP